MSTNSGVTQAVESGVNLALAEVGQLDDQVRTFVRERPVMALIGAVGMGYLVARIFSRL